MSSFITCSTGSNSMGKSIQYNVIIPDGRTENTPNLYLLHGLSDDYTYWHRQTLIERYADELGICVIMPDGGTSFYSDTKHGYAYYSCIVNDIMRSAKELFGISDKREHNFIAGNSMGGYGAFKIALRNPDKFAGCIALSGVLDIVRHVKNGEWRDIFTGIWGEDYRETVPGGEEDLFALIDSFSDPAKPKPKLCSICGTDDFLLSDSRNFDEHIRGKGFDYTYEEHPGSHTWDFWNTHIQHAVEILLNK